MSLTHAAIFIESNTTGSGAGFVGTARSMGLAPVFLTDAPDRYAFLQDMKGVEVVVVDTASSSTVAAALDRLASERSIGLILSTSDAYLSMAATQAARLGLAGPSPAAIALCAHKGRQADALRAAGVGTPPRDLAVTDLSEAATAIASVGIPMVVKPLSGTGSNGVRLAESEAEALSALEQLFAVTVNLRGQPIQPAALLATYVEGDEFSVEILDGRIIGVTKKHLGTLPFFVETGHDYPACIDDGLRLRLESEAQRAVVALGHTRGPAHVEMRSTDEGIAIIEVNPRLAGGSIPSLIRHATGVDAIAAVIESARGGHPDLRRSQAAYGSLRFVVPPADGVFRPLCSPADLAVRFGLAEATLYRDPPFPFRRVNDFRDRVGHVIAVDADPQAAAHRAEAAIAFLISEESHD